MDQPDVTLEQWRALLAVVDAGGYAQAAAQLHKSQSSVTYAVQKLEELLGVKAFEVRGRKAVLTQTGELLYRRARQLIDDARELESAARKVSAGWEAEIRIAVEALFPNWLLFECLAAFGREAPDTRLEVYETVLEGTREMVEQKQVDLAVTPHTLPGTAAEPLARLRIIPTAHPEHPLHKLGRLITRRDLAKHRHLVIRDTSSKRTTHTTTVQVAQRWTVGSLSSAVEAASLGHGFAWLPETRIREQLRTGALKQLPMRDADDRYGELYLVFAERDAAGPGVLRMAEIMRSHIAQGCKAQTAAGPEIDTVLRK